MPSAPFTPGDLDAILFDMDGTLIDTDNVDVQNWQRRIERLTDHPDGDQLARNLITAIKSPVNVAFTLFDMAGLDGPLIRLVVRLQGSKDLATYPAVTGALEAVQMLSDRYRIAAVSTRSTTEIHSFLAGHGVADLFGTLIGRDSTYRIKPHAQPVHAAAAALGVPVERCLMVGDTAVDSRAGRAAGAWCAGVLCGYGKAPELEKAGAHVLLESPADLPALLLT